MASAGRATSRHATAATAVTAVGAWTGVTVTVTASIRGCGRLAQQRTRASGRSLESFATSYLVEPGTGTLSLFDAAIGGQWSKPPAFESGAGGLVSTVDDYHAFARMLLQKGRFGQQRIPSRVAQVRQSTAAPGPIRRGG